MERVRETDGEMKRRWKEGIREMELQRREKNK